MAKRPAGTASNGASPAGGRRGRGGARDETGPDARQAPAEDVQAEKDAVPEQAAEEEVLDEDEDEDEDEEDDEDVDDEEEETVAPAPKPAARPQPGRPPLAKDEPPPPFDVGERVVLVSNTRPRTGTPIGSYAVGATGRVETVLSLTAIVRFDSAPDIKEVVAFTCLESLDEQAKARREAEARAAEEDQAEGSDQAAG